MVQINQGPDILSPVNMVLWNKHGLISANGVVTLSLAALERLLNDARRAPSPNPQDER